MDEARVSILVHVPPADAFRIFTEQIDQWWIHGRKYRVGGPGRSMLKMECQAGGRLLETVTNPDGSRVLQTGTVTIWEPPERLVFNWQAVNFRPDEVTEVEVRFAPSPSGTMVSVAHRGWSKIRPDHPVRHGEAAAQFLATMGSWWADLMVSLRERAEH
jgi:uncharacterized protein YndB with AHSA1/START domain